MTEIKFLKVFLACFLDNLDSAHPNSTGLLSLFLDEERTGGISIQKGKCICVSITHYLEAVMKPLLSGAH